MRIGGAELLDELGNDARGVMATPSGTRERRILLETATDMCQEAYPDCYIIYGSRPWRRRPRLHEKCARHYIFYLPLAAPPMM